MPVFFKLKQTYFPISTWSTSLAGVSLLLLAVASLFYSSGVSGGSLNSDPLISGLVLLLVIGICLGLWICFITGPGLFLGVELLSSLYIRGMLLVLLKPKQIFPFVYVGWWMALHLLFTLWGPELPTPPVAESIPVPELATCLATVDTVDVAVEAESFPSGSAEGFTTSKWFGAGLFCVSVILWVTLSGAGGGGMDPGILLSNLTSWVADVLPAGGGTSGDLLTGPVISVPGVADRGGMVPPVDPAPAPVARLSPGELSQVQAQARVSELLGLGPETSLWRPVVPGQNAGTAISQTEYNSVGLTRILDTSLFAPDHPFRTDPGTIHYLNGCLQKGLLRDTVSLVNGQGLPLGAVEFMFYPHPHYEGDHIPIRYDLRYDRHLYMNFMALVLCTAQDQGLPVHLLKGDDKIHFTNSVFDTLRRNGYLKDEESLLEGLTSSPISLPSKGGLSGGVWELSRAPDAEHKPE